jgi:nucleotide-binding universal stress UspA family protein
MSHSASQPVLLCYDGSPESERGLEVMQALAAPVDMVIVAIWQSVSTKLAQSAGFGVLAVENHETLDVAEERAARRAVDGAAVRARDAGHSVSARVEEAQEQIWMTILAIADEIDAALIVTGSHGRSGLRRALLGSVSHSVLEHSQRPVLIAPSPAVAA